MKYTIRSLFFSLILLAGFVSGSVYALSPGLSISGLPGYDVNGNASGSNVVHIPTGKNSDALPQPTANFTDANGNTTNVNSWISVGGYGIINWNQQGGPYQVDYAFHDPSGNFLAPVRSIAVFIDAPVSTSYLPTPPANIPAGTTSVTNSSTVNTNPNVHHTIPQLDALIAKYPNLEDFESSSGAFVQGLTSSVLGIKVSILGSTYATQATADLLAQAYGATVVSLPYDPGYANPSVYVTGPDGTKNPPELFLKFPDGTLINAGAFAQDYLMGDTDLQIALSEKYHDAFTRIGVSPQGSPITWFPDPVRNYLGYIGIDAQNYTWTVGGPDCHLIAYTNHNYQFKVNPAPWATNTDANTGSCDPGTPMSTFVGSGGSTQTGGTTTSAGSTHTTTGSNTTSTNTTTANSSAIAATQDLVNTFLKEFRLGTGIVGVTNTNTVVNTPNTNTTATVPSTTSSSSTGSSGFPKTITVTSTSLNVRSAPTRTSSLAGSQVLHLGDVFIATGQVQGDRVNGNDVWLVSSLGNYVWSGGTEIKIVDASLNVPSVLSSTPQNQTTVTLIGPYFWSGNVSNVSASSLLSKGQTLAESTGAHVIRISMSAKSDMDYKGGVCIPNFNLTDLAKRSDFNAILTDPQFTTVIITAYDGVSLPDCVTKNYLNPDFYTTTNIQKMKQEYTDFANYLRQFNKTFIISNWEGDNEAYCGLSYNVSLGLVTCPYASNTLNTLTQWFKIRYDGIHSSSASNVFDAIEFNNVNALKNKGLPSVLYDVIPHVNADYYSYSSYESINGSATQLSQDIDTIRSVIGNGKLIIGEFGFAVGTFGDASVTATRMQQMMNVMTDKKVSYGIAWNLLDSPAGYGLFDSSGAITPNGTAVKSFISNQ